MGSPAPDARPSFAVSAASNRVSALGGLPFRETGFCGQRQTAEIVTQPQVSRLWRSRRARAPHQFGAICEEPGNLRWAASAWWAWQDSNLQPNRYERTSPAPRKSESARLTKNDLTARFSTGLPAHEERACETDMTVETSVSMLVSPACPGLRRWKHPCGCESTGGPP